MKDDTSSLRAMARSSRCETDSVVTRTESSIGSRIFPFDQEVVESGPYRSNGALATERHRTNILRTGSSACDTRDRTERYTSQIGFNRDYRSASPRQELAERQFALRVSKSRDDRNKTYARGTRFVLSGDVSENLTRGARPERHVSDPVLAPHLSDLSNSHHDVKGRHQGSVQDSSSTADSQLTSPTINVQDTEPSRTEYSASPVDQWGLPSSSQGSLTLDTLERSPSSIRGERSHLRTMSCLLLLNFLFQPKIMPKNWVYGAQSRDTLALQSFRSFRTNPSLLYL